MSVLSRALVAFDERRADPTTNLGTLGAAGNVAYTGTVRLAPTNTAYVRLPGVAGNYLTTPDPAELAGATQLDLRVVVASDDYTHTGNQVLIAHGNGGASQPFRWVVLPSGVCQLLLGDGAAEQAVSITSAWPLTDATIYALRVDWRGSDQRTRFLYKGTTRETYLADMASNTGWVQHGPDRTMPGAIAALLNGPLAVGYGNTSNGLSTPFIGNFHAAQIATTIDGTPFITVDTAVLTDEGATSFLARTGQTVTINRSTGATYKTEVVVPGTGSRLFNGTSGFGEVADLAGLDFGASDSFTVFALVRQWNTAAVNARYISKRSGSGTGYVLAAVSSTAAQAYVQGAAGSSFITTNLAVAGQMTMLALARPASGAAMRIHMNGTEASAADTSTDLANSNPLTIGADPGGANRGFFRLYAWGVFPGALTSAQLTALRAALTSSDPGDGPRTATLTVPRRNLEISA
jgi:hypothetical protein